MKLTIAGYGFVGKAHYELFKDTHDITVIDPAYPEYNQCIPQDTDAVIICVATPQHENGSCYMNNVYSVIDACPNVPILIKSTISIEGWDLLVDDFPNRNLNFSPEFLRQASWLEDVLHPASVLIGGVGVDFWQSLFAEVYGSSVPQYTSDPRALILTKYFRNSFLATKVAFFNQVYDLCNELGIQYSEVAHYTSADSRIGNSHTQVTEARGFGGHCFPKDTSAIVKTAERNNIKLSLIQEAINYNNAIKK